MGKLEKEDVKSLTKDKLIYEGEGSSIYRLLDNRVLKLAHQPVFDCCKMAGVSYERKILDTRAKNVKEIVCPLTAVYDGKKCIGYTMEMVQGISLNNYDDNATIEQRADLRAYFELYAKIEAVVEKANRLGIVNPDLCTCDNIFFMKDGTIKLIDYDGLQLGPNDASIAISTSLGNPIKYLQSRKFSNGFLKFTDELDKASLAMLMFLWIFNIDLSKIGSRNPLTGDIIDYNYIIDFLGLSDRDFINKIAANLSTDKKGTYLTGDFKKIVDNYDMYAYEIPGTGRFVKRLIRK